MQELKIFLIIFGGLFLIYFIFVILNKNKVANIFLSKEALLIKFMFKVTFNNRNKLLFALVTSFTNALIFAISSTILNLFENKYVGLLVMIPTLIALIFLFYSIVGFIYKKKEGKKDV